MKTSSNNHHDAAEDSRRKSNKDIRSNIYRYNLKYLISS
jgi:hypothetical protein